MSIEFTPGTYHSLRAATKFHLGPLGRDIEAGTLIEFDGNTARIDGATHSLPQLRGCVKAGWLVEASAPATAYRPKPADIPIHAAQPTRQDRGQPTKMTTVHDEERNLGDLKKVRDHGDGIVRKAKVQREDASSDGEVVGRLRKPAVQDVTLTGENIMRLQQEIRKVDNPEGQFEARVIPVKVAHTGDVSEARVGDALDELLGDAAYSSSVPEPGVAGEGDEPHLTAEEKEAKRAAASLAAEQARQARLAQVGAAPTPSPIAPVARPAPVAAAPAVTFEGLIEAMPTIRPVLEAQGIDDVDTLRDVLRDPLAGAELARELKAGPTVKLRKALGLA